MADGIMELMDLLNDIINEVSDIISTFELFGDGVSENCNISKIQIELLRDVIKGISTVLQIVIAVAAKVFNEIKDTATGVATAISNKWNQLKGTLTDNAFVKNITAAWTAIYNKAVDIIGRLKKLWNEFM
jgi:prophage DNA circulation protein